MMYLLARQTFFDNSSVKSGFIVAKKTLDAMSEITIDTFYIYRFRGPAPISSQCDTCQTCGQDAEMHYAIVIDAAPESSEVKVVLFTSLLKKGGIDRFPPGTKQRLSYMAVDQTPDINDYGVLEIMPARMFKAQTYARMGMPFLLKKSQLDVLPEHPRLTQSSAKIFVRTFNVINTLTEVKVLDIVPFHSSARPEDDDLKNEHNHESHRLQHPSPKTKQRSKSQAHEPIECAEPDEILEDLLEYR